jgi:hypothetical protein
MQEQLEAAGARVEYVLAESPTAVAWRRAGYCPFPDRPFVVHPVVDGRLAGSGVFDLSLVEAETMLGIANRGGR